MIVEMSDSKISQARKGNLRLCPVSMVDVLVGSVLIGLVRSELGDIIDELSDIFSRSCQASGVMWKIQVILVEELGVAILKLKGEILIFEEFFEVNVRFTEKFVDRGCPKRPWK
jgi:hypothetical protein